MKKMLQMIINGQSAFRQEVLKTIKKLEEKLDNKIDNLDIKVDNLDIKLDTVEKNLTSRIDKLGKQLAYLEDDAPTREEFDDLEKRVKRVGQTTTPSL